MTDVFDQASDRETQDRELCIKMARDKHRFLPPIGKCHWCGEVVSESRRFCDSDCRDDYERDLKLRNRS